MNHFEELISVTFQIITCGGCAVSFGMPQKLYKERQNDHKNFYCPNGCCRHFTEESEKERLERENEVLVSRNSHLNDQLDSTRRSRDAHKGNVTKIKNRVSKGICPCCKRTFPNLGSHMNQKHPNWSKNELHNPRS